MSDPTAAVSTAPSAADMIEIYYAPSTVFERRRGGQFGLPLLVLVAVGTALYFATAGLTQPVMDAEFARQIARRTATMTPEQAASMRDAMLKTKGFAAFGVPLTMLFAPFIIGTALWLVSMIAKAGLNWKVAVTIAVFSWFPRLIDSIVTPLQLALMPDMNVTSKFSTSLGVGRFLDPVANGRILDFVGRIDLFTIWVTFLIAIGVRVIGRTTQGKAVAIAIAMWLIGGLQGLWTMLAG